MATKKTVQSGDKAPKKSPFELSRDQIKQMSKEAEEDMKKHGFKTVEQLIAYYDSQRGY